MTQSPPYSKVLNRLLYTWVVCYGCLIALTVAGYFVKHALMPVVAFGLVFPIISFGNNNIAQRRANCSLFTHYTFYTLLISGTIMLAVNIINSRWFDVGKAQYIHSEYPFVSTLIVFPVATVMYGIALLRRSKPEYCSACRSQGLNSLKETLALNVFHAEARRQIVYAFCLSAVISAVSLVYYCFFYINVNINAPDTFFYFVAPTICYVLMSGYFATRFQSLKFEVTIAPNHTGSNANSYIRYLVICGDKLLMQEVAVDSGGIGLWDTPAVSDTPYVDNVTDKEARKTFEEISGCKDFMLKKLFDTSTVAGNSFHYAIVLDDDMENRTKLPGQWFTLYEVDAMLKRGLINRPLAYVIHRVFTITMAWKTYDKDGKRLYPIKNYRPTFRLRDFKDWEVDYSDLQWMSVAKNNEDQPFFKLKKFWRKYVSAVDLRWKKDSL